MRTERSDEPEIDLTFPHSYQIQEHYELPGSGVSEIPTFYIPAPRNRIEHDGLWVTVCASSSRTWTGVFAYGDLGAGTSRIMSSPDPDCLIVIARGAGYSVRADDPDAWEKLPISPVRFAFANEKHRIVVFADFSRLAAYDAKGLRWETPLCLDDLRVVAIASDSIEGTGYDPGSAEGTVKFSVDLNSGAEHAH